MTTEQKARKDFLGYYADLADAQRLDGASVPSKFDEWEFFINHLIAEGLAPASASNWPCPRK